MKIILTPILALIIIMMVGCEKEETTEGTSGACILQKISFRIADGSAGYDVDFTYDSQERLVELVRTEFDIGDPYSNSYAIEYGSDGVKKITTSNSLYNGGEIYDFNYINSLIDSVQISYYPDDSFWSRRYIRIHYNGDKISRLDFFNNNIAQGGYVLNRQEDILWNGENVAQAGDWSYTYDDKPSALRHIGMAFTDFESMAMLSKNNIATSTYASGNSNTYTYTYNDQGYPITLDRGYGDGLVYYEYSCK
ncbi:MAG: hypothetical protein HKN68_18755 [Saprospiraceae bacterium]|nr:hypothetical protein [Saprospiraceae bacterium]